MRRRINLHPFWVAVVAAAYVGCGQAPSFKEQQSGAIIGGDGSGGGGETSDNPAGGNGSGNSGNADSNAATNLPGDGNSPIIVTDGSGHTVGGGVQDSGSPGSGGTGTGGGGSGGTTAGGGGSTPSSGGGGSTPVPPTYVIPGADPGDLSAIQTCLGKWSNRPFPTTIANYKRISAQVSVFGMGTGINDTDRTEAPMLILVDAGVNVLGNITYNMMNPNGWYCMKVGVNVMQSLTVNLHCNARLADSAVNVNVGSTTNGTVAAVGVSVLSNINLVTQRPQGDACIR